MNNNKYALVKFIDNDLELDITISPEEDNIWLSKNQISELFDRDRSVISKHIKKIFDDYECDEKSNVQKMHITNSDKLVEFYSLDIIIAVGFKVNGQRAIDFRLWAINILKQYSKAQFEDVIAYVDQIKDRLYSDPFLFRNADDIITKIKNRMHQNVRFFWISLTN